MLYPASLEMEPFLSASTLKRQMGMRRGALAAEETTSRRYELYAIVCHRGDLQACLSSADSAFDVYYEP